MNGHSGVSYGRLTSADVAFDFDVLTDFCGVEKYET
jgi:hypothetical protein